MGHLIDSELIKFTINQDGSSNASEIADLVKAKKYEIVDQALMLFECDLNTWQKEFRIPNGNGFYLTTYVNDTPVGQG